MNPFGFNTKKHPMIIRSNPIKKAVRLSEPVTGSPWSCVEWSWTVVGGDSGTTATVVVLVVSATAVVLGATDVVTATVVVGAIVVVGAAVVVGGRVVVGGVNVVVVAGGNHETVAETVLDTPLTVAVAV